MADSQNNSRGGQDRNGYPGAAGEKVEDSRGEGVAGIYQLGQGQLGAQLRALPPALCPQLPGQNQEAKDPEERTGGRVPTREQEGAILVWSGLV